MYNKMMTTYKHIKTNYPCFSGRGINMQPSFVWERNIDNAKTDIHETRLDIDYF
mgnify:CR=1